MGKSILREFSPQLFEEAPLAASTAAVNKCPFCEVDRHPDFNCPERDFFCGRCQGDLSHWKRTKIYFFFCTCIVIQDYRFCYNKFDKFTDRNDTKLNFFTSTGRYRQFKRLCLNLSMNVVESKWMLLLALYPRYPPGWLVVLRTIVLSISFKNSLYCIFKPVTKPFCCSSLCPHPVDATWVEWNSLACGIKPILFDSTH